MPATRATIIPLILSSLIALFCATCDSSLEPDLPALGESDLGMDVVQTADGGFLVVGETRSRGAGGSDAWLIKTNSQGELEWEATYGGTEDDWAYDLDLLPDGGAIIVGSTNSTGAGETDVWLLRVADNGALLWEQTFGGISYDHGFHVELDHDGGFIVAAETYSFGAGNNDGWLIKTDQMGEIVWEQTYGTGGRERTYWVTVLGDSNYIAVGYTDTLNALEPASDMLLFKVNQTGTVLWQKPYIVGNSAVGRSVVATHDGGYVAAGFFSSTNYGDDIWFLKTDVDGELIWDQVFSGGADDRAAAVAATSDGGYIVTGVSRSYGNGLNDGFLIKTDGQGEIEWNHFYGGASYDIGRAVQQTSEGNYVVAGTNQSVGPGDAEVWLLLVGPNSEQLWSKTFGDASE